MIGIDSNILIRYLMQDDATQSRRATEILERFVSEDNPGFVSVVALAETVWVLERSYRRSDADIVAALEYMLQAEVLIVEDEQHVFTALTLLRDGRGSFADALIAVLCAKAGCSRTLTFDRKAVRLPGFELA